MDHMFLIVMIMIVIGTVGGLINYYLNEKNAARLTDVKKYEMIKSVVIGVGASLLVPLFLNTISSNLVKESKEDPYKLLVFIGFCLVASISSRIFIKSLSGQIIKQLDILTEEVENSRTIVSQIVKNDTKDVIPNVLKANLFRFSLGELEVEQNDDPKISLIRKINQSDYTYYTLESIANEMAIDIEEAKNLVDQLINQSLLECITLDKKELYCISDEGRKILSQ